MLFKRMASLWGACLFLALAPTAFGTPFTTLANGTTCPTPSTVSAYVDIPVDCETGNVNAWFAFNNFVDSPSANNMTIQALANSGFYFPDNGAGPTNFMVGFNVQAFNQMAVGVTYDVAFSSSPQGDPSFTMYTCDGPAMSCLSDPAATKTTSGSAPIETVMFTPTASLGVLFVGSVDSLSTLTEFETSIIGGTGGTGSTGFTGGTGGTGGGVPEPATLMMAAAGLLGLVALRRRRAQLD